MNVIQTLEKLRLEHRKDESTMSYALRLIQPLLSLFPTLSTPSRKTGNGSYDFILQRCVKCLNT